MQSVAKFVTKAYPVSGCFDYLSEVRTERERSVRVCVCARTHVHTCFSRNSDPALESDVNQERSVYVCVRVHVCVCSWETSAQTEDLTGLGACSPPAQAIHGTITQASKSP